MGRKRDYGKLYHMCVVQKCRFQYKYTRYQQDLIRMKELQEEYLFLNREGINCWEDVFRVDSIGVVYRYSDDMLDEFMRLESVVAQMKREEKEAEKEPRIEIKTRTL